jgi:hypothetical protein
MTGAAPGIDGPWATERETGAGIADGSVAVLIPGRQPVTGVSARLLQRDLSLPGGQVELVRLDLDEEIDRQLDLAFEVRRDGPRPPLAARVPGDDAELVAPMLVAADASAAPASPAVAEAQDVLHDLSWDRPLYRIAVAHVWRVELEGVRASSWPGIGFWDVAAWRWGEDGPPEQEATIEE